jgi:hypothetical protein
MLRNSNKGEDVIERKLELNFTVADLRIIVEALAIYKQVQIEDLKSAIYTDEDQTQSITKYTLADNLSMYIKHKATTENFPL